MFPAEAVSPAETDAKIILITGKLLSVQIIEATTAVKNVIKKLIGRIILKIEINLTCSKAMDFYRFLKNLVNGIIESYDKLF